MAKRVVRFRGVAAFVLGAAGSGHCATMCGPLVALANPRGATAAERAEAARFIADHGLPAFGRALYNANEFLRLD